MTGSNRNRRTRRADGAAGEDAASGRGRPWLALLVFIILAGVAAWFWLARDPEAREELTRRAAENRPERGGSAAHARRGGTGAARAGHPA